MNNDSIVNIKRVNMRGGDNKIVISFDEQSVTIKPTYEQIFRLIKMLMGGPCESVQIVKENQ